MSLTLPQRLKELFKLLVAEVQRRLMFRHACVRAKAIDVAAAGDDTVNGARDGCFRSDIAVDVLYPLGVLTLDSLELFAWLEQIKRVHAFGIVRQTYLSNA